MARRKGRRSTVYIVSVGAHLVLGLAIALIPKDKLREVIGISMSDAKKEAPKPPPPPKHDDTQRARPAHANGQHAARSAAAPAAGAAEAAAAVPVFTDIGIALDSSAEGGIAVQMAPKPVERIAPLPVAPPKPKVLVARVAEETCAEPLVKARLVRQAQPRLPSGVALNAHGPVRVQLEIDDKGAVRSVKVLHGLGEVFDEAAVEAARKVEFTPATLCGKPVASQFVLSFRY